MITINNFINLEDVEGIHLDALVSDYQILSSICDEHNIYLGQKTINLHNSFYDNVEPFNPYKVECYQFLNFNNNRVALEDCDIYGKITWSQLTGVEFNRCHFHDFVRLVNTCNISFKDCVFDNGINILTGEETDIGTNFNMEGCFVTSPNWAPFISNGGIMKKAVLINNTIRVNIPDDFAERYGNQLKSGMNFHGLVDGVISNNKFIDVNNNSSRLLDLNGSTYQNTFSYRTRNVTIIGNEFIGSVYGIQINCAKSIRVLNNEFSNQAANSILLQNIYSCSFEDDFDFDTIIISGNVIKTPIAFCCSTGSGTSSSKYSVKYIITNNDLYWPIRMKYYSDEALYPNNIKFIIEDNHCHSNIIPRNTEGKKFVSMFKALPKRIIKLLPGETSPSVGLMLISSCTSSNNTDLPEDCLVNNIDPYARIYENEFYSGTWKNNSETATITIEYYVINEYGGIFNTYGYDAYE